MMEHAYTIKGKLNVVPQTDTKMHEGFHVDFRDPSIKRSSSCGRLLYMNTTNGPTVFEDGEEIDCVENRLVIFDGLRRHTGLALICGLA